MIRRFLFLFSITACGVFGAPLPKAACIINVNEHLSSPQPLLLLQNGAVNVKDAFPLPDDDGDIEFPARGKIDLACPRNQVVISESNTEKVMVEAQCDIGAKFIVQGKTVHFTEIKCKSRVKSIAQYNGKKCGKDKYKEIEIGFLINARFVKQLVVCFDDVLQNSLYTQSYLTSNIGGVQIGYPRPNFTPGNFYNVQPNSVEYLYSRKGQSKNINLLLGLQESNTSIIHPTNDYFLSKGHYAPKSDFIYGTQQDLTFYYVNVAPQWQTFNGGNWNALESSCKELASSRRLNLTVYTGSYGVTTLPDTKGNDQKLYLYIGKNGQPGLPVPAIFYKVLYEPKSKAGIVLIGVNNPYKNDVSKDIICNDVCNKIKWLKWKSNNLKLGYSYCCEVNDFKKTVTVLPDFDVKSLLV